MDNDIDREEEEIEGKKEMSFWDHLDDLRGTLIRIAIGIVVCMILVFANKEFVFGIIFAPSTSDFVLYKALCKLGEWLSFPGFCIEPFEYTLHNITVSGQFFAHISTSFWLGLVLSFPWTIYQLWLFVSPALYKNEKKAATGAFFATSFLFFIGVLVGYFLVFPVAVHFLGGYQLLPTIGNNLTITSYIDMFVMLVLSMGIVFQLPILVFILSKLGIINKAFLKTYRRYAIVIILILAAVITPTPDPFTMMLVAGPMLLLYEFSIFICKNKNRNV